MKNLRQDCFNPNFYHIYVEEGVRTHPRTERILAHFPGAKVIAVDHYKDVFNRRGQSAALQHKAQALILARKEPPYLYEGAPVCPDFGNANFYYASAMRGCVFDCDYCYLKGMYPSGHLVIFVNMEDYFAELEALLVEKNVYLCVSYDADLLALEPIAGTVRRWADFAGAHGGLTIEVRTKSARLSMWEELPCLPNVIYAFTLSPQSFIEQNERGTPSASARIACALEGLRRGYPVRLCFDPMLYAPDWREAYGELLRKLDRAFSGAGLSMGALSDVSVGCFRISQEYMKRLRRAEPMSAVVQFPFENVNGVYQYPQELKQEMEGWMIAELGKRVDGGRIYHE